MPDSGRTVEFRTDEGRAGPTRADVRGTRRRGEPPARAGDPAGDRGNDPSLHRANRADKQGRTETTSRRGARSGVCSVCRSERCCSRRRRVAATSTGTTPAHYETTDDAFIAARQFAIAPKVPGYITAVPVTDNQHVATGKVIARIDERDYRTALAQAEAQVAAAQASIEQHRCPDRRPAGPGRRRPRRRCSSSRPA